MPGLYDNETQQYIEEEHYMEGNWYVDREGFLYIVPLGPEDEVIGPDGPKLELIARACRHCGGVLPDEACKCIGLNRIPHVSKRFSPEEGYYYA
jgi:hypothetical protein